MEREQTEKNLEYVSTYNHNIFDIEQNDYLEVQWEKFMNLVHNSLPKMLQEHKAGALSRNLDFWKKITSDYVILNNLKGYKIEFSETPTQKFIPFQYKFSSEESEFIGKELQKMLSKQIIRKVSHESGEFISNIFLRPKKDGSYRMILNLEHLNENVVYKHFKMETFAHAVSLVTKNCWFASIDWKDAYYTLKIHPSCRKFLRFQFDGNLYEFLVLPNGLSSGPRQFSKTVKPLFSDLRKQGFLNSSYIDDSLLIGESYNECRNNVIKTTMHSLNAGFLVHPEKSVFMPSQIIEFLGFIINSIEMTITLPERKKVKIIDSCNVLLKKCKCQIRQLSELLGSIIATFPAAQYGHLHYRIIEREKIFALKANNDNYDAFMQLSKSCKGEILWWKENVNTVYADISHGSPKIVLTSDSSKKGWGGVNNTSGETANGKWNNEEQKLHINFLELLAAWFTIKSLCKNVSNTHILLRLDNTTAVSYLTKMGGRKKSLDKLANIIWQWAIKNNVWLSASHLPGSENDQADKLSRLKSNEKENTEWKLNEKIFKKLVNIWGKPEIDMFASRHNNQLSKYVSWKPDPMAQAVDAFCQNWAEQFCYIFAPFSQIHRVLQKIDDDKAECMVILPFWSTQPWFSKMMHMLTDYPIFLPREKGTLTHPFRKITDLPKTRLIGVRLSGKRYKHLEFLNGVKKLSCIHGSRQQVNNTMLTQRNTLSLRVRNISIPIRRLWEM